MESIEKLRELAMDMNSTEIISHTRLTPLYLLDGDWLDSWHRAFDKACDEIEREIEDKIDGLMATSVDGYPDPFNTPDAMHMVLGTAADCFDTPQEAVHYLRGETSMLLPVDADGVPWHIGEEIKLPYGNRDKVRFMTIRERDVVVNERGWVADQCRHVNPCTIEDVLREFRFDANLIYGNPNIGGEERADELAALDSKYTDELRGMGVGE